MPARVESAAELLSLAFALEKEAGRRYLELAASMRLRNEGRLAALFEFLASIEDKHAAGIAERSRQRAAAALPADLAAQEAPENFESEAGESALLTPYRALAIAVRNEVRAFTFFSYLAAMAPDDSIRKIAEELAQDELVHADLLRRERRKAYRAEKAGGPRTFAQLPQTLAELWSLCFEMEAAAAGYHRALAESLRSQEQVAAAFMTAAKDEEECAREAAGHTGQSPAEKHPTSRPNIRGGQRLLEEAFERYSDIGGRSKQEDVMQQALILADRASRRLFLASLALARPAQ